jgi:hypothetical protein
MKYYYLNKSSINERRRTLYNTRSSTSVDSTYGYLSTFQNWKPTYVDEDNQKWFNFNTQTFQFESKLLNLNLGLCINCHQRRLGLQITNNICGRCNKHSNKETYSHANKVLPTWINDQGQVLFEIPVELSSLTIAEKLLIQRVSPLIPVIHIKKLYYGIKGTHC